MKEKIIYEDSEHHNVIFVGKNEMGAPMYSHAKSTASKCSFRSDISGSDKSYAFHYSGNSERLFVFESAIDMLSFISLTKEIWQQDSYIALGGVADKSLIQLLSHKPVIKEIVLCLDNDTVGQEASKQITQKLQDQGYSLTVLVPDLKDWNEDLINHNSEEQEVMQYV